MDALREAKLKIASTEEAAGKEFERALEVLERAVASGFHHVEVEFEGAISGTLGHHTDPQPTPPVSAPTV